MSGTLLAVEHLRKHFPITRGVLGRQVGAVRAVDDVSFEVKPGETLGLVGESGCGKTTVGRSVLRLLEPTSGRVTFEGRDVLAMKGSELRALRREMQLIFQDPFSSLNPRMRVLDIIGESLEVHGLTHGERTEKRVLELMRRVGLPASWMNRYPHEFSGGQRQRIGIARAIALSPKLVVCDEAVSALDVSIQAQVINLLVELRREMGLAYLFIAHDLSVVRHLSHRVAVMYLGEIVEHASSARLFAAPSHPYTRALLSAIPLPDPRRSRQRIVLTGDVPSPANPPSGCRFHTRCPAVMDRCRAEVPPVYTVETGHTVRCFHAEGVEGAADAITVISKRIEERTAENAREAPVTVVPETVVETLRASMKQTAPSATANARGKVPAPANRLSPGIAAVIAGLLLVVFGHPVLGLLVATGAYVLSVRGQLAKARPADALFVVAMLAGLFASRGVSALERKSRAREQLDALAAELVARQKLTNEPAQSLSDLGYRLYPIFEDGRPIDPWGRPYVYRPGQNGAAFELRSTGPDGVPSDDDLTPTSSR